MIRAIDVIWLTAAIGPIFAQPATPAFDVASVKPSESRYADLRVTGGSLTIVGLDLRVIVQEAFGVKWYQISGGPSWITADRFDIFAKAEGNFTRSQVMAMLQTLLADRFQLKVHRESREGNIYALAVAKSGPKLKPPSGERTYIGLYRNDPPTEPGLHYSIAGNKATSALLAERLGDMQLGRPVMDRTGIQGEFDFKVDYAVDDHPESGPSLLTAIQEQLGLKLEPTKGPVETLVIDHVAKPSGN